MTNRPKGGDCPAETVQRYISGFNALDDAELAALLHHWLSSANRIAVGGPHVTPVSARRERQAVTVNYNPYITIDYGGVALLPRDEIMRTLPDLWLDNYYQSHADAELVETTVTGFSYLFDVVGERLVAAYGVSGGKHGEPRPSSRMRGHPLNAGPLYHRGHTIPHTLGGGTDIGGAPTAALPYTLALCWATSFGSVVRRNCPEIGKPP